MTQLFIGYKPNVGPVLKCLKYDGDNPLTLANDAYDRYYFNSENQDLSYVFTALSFDFTYSNINNLPTSFDIGGTTTTAKISGRYTNYSTFKDVTFFYRLNNIIPNMTYPPITEFRVKSLSDGRVIAGSHETFAEGTSGPVYYRLTNYHYFYPTLRVNSYSSSTTTQTRPLTYNGQVINALNRIPIGSWASPVSALVWNDGIGDTVLYPNWWDLPADNSPMRSYSPSPSGTLMLEASPSRFILSRPGYSVDSTHPNSKIIDSNSAPALCIMNGERLNISNGGSVTIPAPPGITISERAVVDFIYRFVGNDYSVPALINSQSTGVRRVSYTVSSSSITIYNNSGTAIDIRYVVFNTDTAGTSSGGNQVLFRGNDGSMDFVQIKKPGTSDPASRPNDILFDTRFPTFQIIQQDYIDISSFSNSPSGETSRGTKKRTIAFNNQGFIPYIKYSLVFPNCVSTPYFEAYSSGLSGVVPSNTSSVAFLTDNAVTFYASPGNWSTMSTDSNGRVQLGYNINDPIGIRYYIFGIPT